MAEPPLLTLAGVHTHIGRYHILHGVDLAVAEGEVSVLLGRNGAGKTTTLRSIMGLWRVSRGAIDFAGQPIAARATPDIARLGIAYVPENMGVFSGLTVAENFRLATPSGRFEPRRLARLMTAFPVLEQKWQVRAGTLSGGQKQMLAIGRAIIAERRRTIIFAVRDRLRAEERQLASTRERLVIQARHLILSATQMLASSRQLLAAYDPHRRLAQGWSIVSDARGGVVSSISDVVEGDDVTIRVRDGSLLTRVSEKKGMP